MGLRQTEGHYHNLNYHQNILQSTDSELTMAPEQRGLWTTNDTGPLLQNSNSAPPLDEIEKYDVIKAGEGKNLELNCLMCLE